ncbi:hypothetical protein D3C85_580190 [compost metagenome]
MTSKNIIHPPRNEKLTLAQVAACKTPAQVMKLFGYGSDHLKADVDWGFEPTLQLWTMVHRDWEMRFDTCLDRDGKRNPVFHATCVVDSGTAPKVYTLFKASSDLPNFNFPLDKKQAVLWVCAEFERHDNRFRNAMIIGSFADCLKMFVKPDHRKMEAAYAQLVSNLDPSNLGKLRTALQDSMLDEIEEAEQQHNFTVANIRNRYRNQLNYFTGLFDEAQAAIDAKQKAQYAFELHGYPPSKLYSTYKEARRSHSRRNVPNVDCVIYRFVKKQPHKFARWSVDDRVWIIL